jgi:5'-3' exonuclease
MEKVNRVLIVDGMALLFRAYYATSYSGYIRRTKAGIPTNAIYGFLQYFFDAVKEFQPSHVVCCWDMGSQTFRSELYTHYKSNRPSPPDDLIPQFDLIKEVVADLGVPNIGLSGYEADDCIGTLALEFSKESDVFILTGDHDMLQLVSERVSVIIMKKGKANYMLYSLASLFEERSLLPHQVIELKAFMGDASDNYPGVRGIGEKTAHKLIQDYKTIQGVIDNIHLLPNSVRTKIELDLEMLHLSRKLAEIYLEVPVQCGLEESIWNVQHDIIMKRFVELEFESLMKLLG